MPQLSKNILYKLSIWQMARILGCAFRREINAIKGPLGGSDLASRKLVACDEGSGLRCH